jgi:hypothetical protein
MPACYSRVPFRFQASAYGICGKQSGSGSGVGFPLWIFLPPVLHVHSSVFWEMDDWSVKSYSIKKLLPGLNNSEKYSRFFYENTLFV